MFHSISPSQLPLKLKVVLQILFFVYLSVIVIHCKHVKNKKHSYKYKSQGRSTQNPYTSKTCIEVDYTLRAKYKTCFLRPDTGPCRADILQWYFDVKQKKCYRFFWGGCQGNGNRFETKDDCINYCYLDINAAKVIPQFCSLPFDYGTCFGHYNRWSWDRFYKTCKLRIYSGCGGNQNNFETRSECLRTCLTAPNNTMRRRSNGLTTCVPFLIPEL